MNNTIKEQNERLTLCNYLIVNNVNHTILKKIETYEVPKLDKQERLSDHIPGKFQAISSKKGMKKAIEKRLVKINGEIGHTADYLTGGEIIELFQSKPKEHKTEIDLDLEVLFEDEYLAVINKPAGIVVSGNKRWKLENALNKNLSLSKEKDALTRAEPIHRLDLPTSGALLCGKTHKAVMLLNKLFEEKKIEKIYHAVTIGKMEEEGQIDSEIKTKNASTSFKLLKTIESEKFEQLNLVELKPLTGRRHQLRIHLLELSNPILGDAKYGIEGKQLKGKGLYLHASSLEFTHPITLENLRVQSNLPKKFEKLFPDFKL